LGEYGSRLAGTHPILALPYLLLTSSDYIERHTNSIANDIRDALDNATWLPDSLKPPHQSTSHFFARAPPPPQGIIEQTTAWVSQNRTVIAVVVAFAGTTTYLVHRRKRAHARKRRAKRLSNGAKKEIVVLACSTFHDPLTRSLAVDLERRGYVVYVTVSSTEEDSLIQQEAKADLRPLWMDLTSTVPNPAVDTHPNLEPIRELLKSSGPSSSPPGRHGQGSSMSNMTLAGLIIFPGCSGYPDGALATISPADVVDTLNTRVLAPILTIQQFLPLLSNHSPDPSSPPAVILAYPSISSSLTPPNQIPETITTTSLSALAASLRREFRLAHTNVTITELKLGNFDLGSVNPQPHDLDRSAHGRGDASPPDASSALTHWHSTQRAAIQRSSLGQSSVIKRSSAREFHNAVFDALAPPHQTFRPFGRFEWTTSRNNRSDVVFVGSGARLYDIAGKVMPSGLVAWMMGYRARKAEVVAKMMLSRDEEAGLTETGQPLPMWGSGSGGSSHHSVESDSAIWEKV